MSSLSKLHDNERALGDSHFKILIPVLVAVITAQVVFL